MVAGLSVITLTDSWKLTLFRARSLGAGSLTSSAARHDFCEQTNKRHEGQTYYVEVVRSHDHVNKDNVCSKQEIKRTCQTLNFYKHTHPIQTHINLSVCIAVVQCVKLNLCSDRIVL